MWDERSFSTVSYDQRSWWFGILTNIVKKFKQWYVKSFNRDIHMLNKTTDLSVKVRPNGR